MPHEIPTTPCVRIFQFVRLPAVVLLAVIAARASAYDAPLTPAALHDAYVLGQRNDQATAAFRSPYLKQLTDRAADPHIAEIEILTPFAQVVDQSRRMTSGYTEQQSAQDYHQRGDTILVRILLMLPAAYPKEQSNPETSSPPSSSADQNSALRPENFWQNFRFALKQHGKVIPTRSIHNTPVHSTPTPDAAGVLDGATVWLEYDGKDVASDDATIEVVTPDSKTISAVFDLKKLR